MLPAWAQLSNSGFALGTFTGGFAEVMHKTFRNLLMLCFTSWLRSFPVGILARYQDAIFCVSWLLLPRPAEGLEDLCVHCLPRPWGFSLRLHHFLRLGFCRAATLLLHEPFGKRALQSLLNLRADQIHRNNGDRFACLGRPVFLGNTGVIWLKTC
ncbi:unnamed protein product [Rangifer tarandus platyrhynchus]|uniref:Uncharacterized protein n=1 Tax=Rangifer tarandus platyrhynchus TaxID=3082113 RepID=A0AC59ZEC6_RANTA